MYKLYQHTIYKSLLLGTFKTKKEANKEKAKVEKEGVGLISIKKSKIKK